IQYLQAEYLLKINGKLAVSANASFMWHVLRLPMSFFSQRQPGEVAVRRTDNESIAASIMGKLAPLLINLGAVVVYLVIMFRYSLPLTLIAIFSLCVNFFFSRFIAKKQANISRVRLRDEGLKQSAAVSGIKMIETLKASGAEEGFFEKWSGLQAAVNTSEAKAFQIASLWGSIPGFITQLSNFAVLAVGIYLCMNGWFTVGLLFAFQSYMSQISAPAASIISVGSMFSELRVKMERILDVMKYEPDVPETIPEAESYDKLGGEIELKNVTFGYSKLSEPIIRDFSISVKKGQRVAIVGTSGCGKSTVSKLITGLYEPWSGSITYDGKSRNEINRHVFTSSITVVDQDITLFGDTIAANIKMWDGSIDDSDMISAARDSKLHTVIMERDGGYDYKMADGGRDFSGGQCQRLEITRALAGSPTLIILDEATSALDAKTEFDVISAIKGRGITCIIIAHRLSTIRDCDEIIVLDKGVIVERGTHEQLLAQGGRYNELISNE
ncbi:MAG: ATP-binding cassette domain-containing protein, partial [Ruminococcus sp.]|nr:ATP-binding cassette domain-containing protein [Ruminococcus sp.]